MSPSLLVYKESGEPFRDVDLFAVVALLQHFVEQGLIDVRLSGLIATWKDACEMNSGPGTIDFDFSPLDAGPGLAERLRAALVWVGEEIARQWASAIPSALLNKYDSDDVTVRDFPVERMIANLQRLGRLIGNAEPDQG